LVGRWQSGWNYMLYKHFPPNLTHATALPCETQMFSIVTTYITLKCIICNKVSDDWISTPHSKLNLVYLAELLVVMTDRLKIVRIHALNVPRVHEQKRLDDDAFLLLQESDGVACWCAEVPSCLNIKNRPRTSCARLAVASEQESCRDSMSSSLWHQIWAVLL